MECVNACVCVCVSTKDNNKKTRWCYILITFERDIEPEVTVKVSVRGILSLVSGA